MKTLNFKILPYWLLIMVLFTCSCKGQISTGLAKKSINDTTNGKSKTSKIKSTKNGNVHCAVMDKAGNLWFGTTGNGVYRFDGKTFTNFTEEDGLFNNYVSAILEDENGEIWFGTNDGISRYNGKKFTNIPLGVITGTYLKTYKSPDDLKNIPPKNAIWSMMQDKSGKIWIGTYNAGVFCYDGKSIINFLDNESVINTDKIRLAAVNSIIEDKSGNIWFSTWFEGLCRYDGKEIISFKPNGEIWYSSVFNDKAGNIWIGRRTKGAIIYDGKNFTNVIQGGTFDSCCVGALLEDKSGNIWFNSMHSNMALRETLGGLWKYDGKTFKNFTTKDGLDNNNIWSAVEDKTGNLWFGAVHTSLYRYNGSTFTSFAE